MRMRGLSITLALCLSVSIAQAFSNFSFTGTFSEDDQLELLQFTVPSTSAVTLRTWSYAGGTNAAGTVIASGGFDTVLSLFNATGGLTNSSLLVGSNDDGAGVATDPSTGNAFDALLSLPSLGAGTYVLVLSESDNLANGPTYGDGFSQTGNGDFTPGSSDAAGRRSATPRRPSATGIGQWTSWV